MSTVDPNKYYSRCESLNETYRPYCREYIDQCVEQRKTRGERDSTYELASEGGKKATGLKFFDCVRLSPIYALHGRPKSAESPEAKPSGKDVKPGTDKPVTPDVAPTQKASLGEADEKFLRNNIPNYRTLMRCGLRGGWRPTFDSSDNFGSCRYAVESRIYDISGAMSSGSSICSSVQKLFGRQNMATEKYNRDLRDGMVRIFSLSQAVTSDEEAKKHKYVWKEDDVFESGTSIWRASDNLQFQRELDLLKQLDYQYTRDFITLGREIFHLMDEDRPIIIDQCL